VRLEGDIECTDESALIVTGDNTVIDLNGHRIICTGGGYQGSCQGTTPDDFGILVEGRRNVHIFSHRPGGTITGFDAAINIQNSDDVKVKQIIATGPAGAPGVVRPPTVGILIQDVDCGGGNVRIGGGTKTGNDVSNHTRGIQVETSSCVYIGHNRVHHNREHAPLGEPLRRSGGIGLFDSPDNHVSSNVVFDNGDNNEFEAGIGLIEGATTNNLVVGNQANDNEGNGIETILGASNNYIVNNVMLRNTNTDAFSDQSGPNRWNENNRCVTQTTPQPPPDVCGPDEA
jgi:hypothetical protein